MMVGQSVLIGRGGLPRCPQEMSMRPEEVKDTILETQSEPK